MDRSSEQRRAFPLRMLCFLSGVLGIPGIMITHVTPQRSEAIFTPKAVITVLSLLSLLTFTWLTIQLSRRTAGPSQKVRFLTILLSSTLAGAYMILVLFLVLFQDQFILRNSLIFQPKPMTAEAASVLVKGDIETLNFIAADQTRLQGWLLKNSSRDKSPLIIYFGGSSQEVSNMIPSFQELDGWSIALVNYRGYGWSEGSPSEEHLFQDAILIYDTLAQRDDIDPTRIVAMGWSLGTGVAVYLSEQRSVARTILVTPFDSWAHMLQTRDFPLVPLSFIHDEYWIFNSIQRAPSIGNPLLCLVGAEDNIVLPILSQSLVDKWGGEATMIVYEHADHRLLFQGNSSWNDISESLAALE